MHYTKPTLTFEEQMDLLRGLAIPDAEPRMAGPARGTMDGWIRERVRAYSSIG